ncbi:hypothetical protein [Microcystis aeruginosa]|uniref:hypothetical protein n=1 Tax=Microcystis aeruginosa TaxID=1126 RepID=UPI001293D921|nr:hypothetical protein [Microcystis aeruginosa]
MTDANKDLSVVTSPLPLAHAMIAVTVPVPRDTISELFPLPFPKILRVLATGSKSLNISLADFRAPEGITP